MAVHVCDRFTDRGIGSDWKHGAKYLFAHYREPVVGLDHEHRPQLALTPCGLLAFRGKLDYWHAGGLCFLDVLCDPLVVTLVDHAGVISVTLQVRIHPADRLTGETDELVTLCCRHEDV